MLSGHCSSAHTRLLDQYRPGEAGPRRDRRVPGALLLGEFTAARPDRAVDCALALFRRLPARRGRRNSTPAPKLEQVGFARVVTDYTTFAWLCDVFVAEEARGQALGKQLVESVLAHPELQGLRRWMLATRDAHELYRRFGFRELAAPERWMERFQP